VEMVGTPAQASLDRCCAVGCGVEYMDGLIAVGCRFEWKNLNQPSRARSFAFLCANLPSSPGV
jgi:hypothetical protein